MSPESPSPIAWTPALRRSFGCRIGQSLGLILLLLVSLLPGTVAQAASLPPAQTYFLPLPEDQIRAAFQKIYSGVGTQIVSLTGVSVTADQTVIYYDHWEDGYEIDIANPTQATTQIWGDGNAANGCAPGVTCSNANDVLNSGRIVTLRNEVPLPRNAGTILYDGRDKLGATKAIAVTRSAWATSPGTVLADATEVYDVSRQGTSYKLPIGENLSSMSSAMFEFVSLRLWPRKMARRCRSTRMATGRWIPTSR